LPPGAPRPRGRHDEARCRPHPPALRRREHHRCEPRGRRERRPAGGRPRLHRRARHAGWHAAERPDGAARPPRAGRPGPPDGREELHEHRRGVGELRVPEARRAGGHGDRSTGGHRLGRRPRRAPPRRRWRGRLALRDPHPMIWQSPWWLWALVLIPVLGVLGVVWARDRQRAGREYANPGLLPVGATRRRRRFRAVAFVLALLAVACGPVALARPSIDRTHKQERSVVMIAIDTSRSMQKSDLQPSRLAAALDAAKRFIDVVPKHTQVGLLSFAKSARVIAAPTNDRAALDRVLQHWPPTGVGTAIGDAL